MRVDDFGRDFSIRWRWFSPMYFGLLFFCIAWDSFLIFWYSMALHMKHVPWLMVVFPIGYLSLTSRSSLRVPLTETPLPVVDGVPGSTVFCLASP